MPSLDEYKNSSPVKMLLLGDSGSGKTGALSSLANAGHRLVISDYDNGLEALSVFTKPECLSNVFYITLTDKMKGSAHGAIPVGLPTAASRGLRLLDNWVDGDVKLGPVTSWGLDTTYVCDSFTFFGEAAMRYYRAINGRAPQEPSWQSDWGQAMGMQESMLELLYSDAVKCNVIITSHIIQIGGDEKTGEGARSYPSALGRKLPPKVPRYFNAVFMARSMGQRRVIRTQTLGDVELKCPDPKNVPKELPLETGLADYYKIRLGEVPKWQGIAQQATKS